MEAGRFESGGRSCDSLAGPIKSAFNGAKNGDNNVREVFHDRHGRIVKYSCDLILAGE